MPGIKHLCSCAAGHEQETCSLVQRYSMWSVLTTRCRPLRYGFMSLEIDGDGEVLVLVVHVKAAALCVNCIAFGPPFESQLGLLSQTDAVQNANRIVAR